MIKKLAALTCSLLALVACRNVIELTKLTNRMFSTEDLAKVHSLYFTSDSTCIYRQIFLCDMDMPYKETVVHCRYTFDGRLLILHNQTTHPDSTNATCFSLPVEQVKKCEVFVGEYLLLDREQPFFINFPKSLGRMNDFGYINNVTTDTLYYKKNVIHYGKSVTCLQSFEGDKLVDKFRIYSFFEAK